jgi:hypothetical protein
MTEHGQLLLAALKIMKVKHINTLQFIPKHTLIGLKEGIDWLI